MQKPNDDEQRSQRGPAVPFGSSARQPGKIWRKGYLDFGSRQSLADSGRYATLMQGLTERGYTESANVVLEARDADGDADRLSREASPCPE